MPAKFARLLIVVSVLLVALQLPCVQSFECGDGQIIEDSMVNDDYCDCVVTGADETRTSACSLRSRFLCSASERYPGTRRWISASFVMDGVRDCCDGEDEGMHGGDDSAVRRCETQQAEAERKQEARDRERRQGALIRQELSASVGDKWTSFTEQAAQVQQKESELLQQLKALGPNPVDRRAAYTLYRQYKQAESSAEQVRDLLDNRAEYFGQELEYFPLLGTCIDVVSHELDFKGGSPHPVSRNHTFKLCPFRFITQQLLSNETDMYDQLEPGSEATLLGVWSNWAVPGKVMHYDSGQECWGAGGRPRSTEVSVLCGAVDELSSVIEDGMCNYRMEFKTPLACGPLDRAEKDEL